MMMKFTFYIYLLSLCFEVLATHNRAGEITFEHISGYTYEVTITTYTYQNGLVQREYLTADWGDNTFDTVNIEGGHIYLPNKYFLNIYKKTHTYPGPGIYEVLVQDPNRNYGVLNIPNSVYTYFAIKTQFIINSSVGFNNSPVLLNPPKDRAAVNQIFIHNPAAYDPDGDSISYKLAVCLEQNGFPIEGYYLPENITINEVTGDLIWNVPKDTGKFNVAMFVEEWRNKIKISSIVRDIQIDVVNSDNDPPLNYPVEDICRIAGENINFQVTSEDSNLDPVTHFITGGPFVVSVGRATLDSVHQEFGLIISEFNWDTRCEHVRNLPYQLLLKADDNNAGFNMVDLDNFYIRIISPPPANLSLVSTSDNISLNWEACPCSNAEGYYIYRKELATGFEPDSCEFGVPASLEYEKIAEVNGVNTNSYVDNNNGEGLLQGVEYCYLVTAYFKDGAESIVSNEACGTLIPGIPSMINASVITDNQEVFVAWAKPQNVDTFGYAPPYVFEIHRSDTSSQESFELRDTLITMDLTDTTYIDNIVSFEARPVYYTVKLKPFGSDVQLGSNEVASTVLPKITPMDNKLQLDFIKKVPWVNRDYIIYRSNSPLGIFDSIGHTAETNFIDYNLTNGVEYCYRIISKGSRLIDSVEYFSENISHITCGIPVDNEPPCAPRLSVLSLCDSVKNKLAWIMPDSSCSEDVQRYRIYYSPLLNLPMFLIDSVEGINSNIYYHDLSYLDRPAGCYYVTAVDSNLNESIPSNKPCVDDCILYELPNYFTPNGDNANDIFRSLNKSNYVKKVDMKIFNRWGNLVYKTDDPDINWDGRHIESKKLVGSGIYYYICNVSEPRISGEVIIPLVGFIYVFGDEENAKFDATEF